MILPSKTKNNTFKEQPRRFSSPPISQRPAPYLAGKLTWFVSMCPDSSFVPEFPSDGLCWPVRP